MALACGLEPIFESPTSMAKGKTRADEISPHSATSIWLIVDPAGPCPPDSVWWTSRRAVGI